MSRRGEEDRLRAWHIRGRWRGRSATRRSRSRHARARTGRAAGPGRDSSGSTACGHRCWRRRYRRHAASWQTPTRCSRARRSTRHCPITVGRHNGSTKPSSANGQDMAIKTWRSRHGHHAAGAETSLRRRFRASDPRRALAKWIRLVRKTGAPEARHHGDHHGLFAQKKMARLECRCSRNLPRVTRSDRSS